jgi:hypothetical protein
MKHEYFAIAGPALLTCIGYFIKVNSELKKRSKIDSRIITCYQNLDKITDVLAECQSRKAVFDRMEPDIIRQMETRFLLTLKEQSVQSLKNTMNVYSKYNKEYLKNAITLGLVGAFVAYAMNPKYKILIYNMYDEAGKNLKEYSEIWSIMNQAIFVSDILPLPTPQPVS